MLLRAILPALALALCGCGTTVFFETEVKGSTTIQGSPLGGLLNVFPQAAGFSNLNMTQTQDFQNQGVKKEDVKSVKLRKISLVITSPASGDFSFLQSLHLFASANGQREEVAFKDGIDKLPRSNTLELELKPVELKPFVVADSMSLTTEATGRQPGQDTSLDATVRFGVDAVIIK
jgi:hypothetical protein